MNEPSDVHANVYPTVEQGGVVATPPLGKCYNTWEIFYF